MSGGRWVGVLVVMALLLALVGWALFGDPAGMLASLLMGLPVLQGLFRRGKEQAAREQAERDRAAAQAQRDAVAKDLATIDARTADEVAAARDETAEALAELDAKWRQKRPPDQAAVDEMLKRFPPAQ